MYTKDDEIADLKRRLDDMAERLCSVGQAYERGEQVPSEVLSWWREHKQADADRGNPWPVCRRPVNQFNRGAR